MAEGDPKAGITEDGIDSPQGIEKARKVQIHLDCAWSLPGAHGLAPDALCSPLNCKGCSQHE